MPLTLQDILDWDYFPYAVAGAAVAATIPLGLKIKSGLDRKRRRDAYPKDTVILHQVGRGPYAPSLSPFPLKLETYLRFAKIPYQNEHGMEMSAKSKTPWITYNGEDVADSQFSIEFLNEKRGIDLNSHLTEEEKAIARAFQKMVEENLYWIAFIWRWVYDDLKFAIQHLPRIRGSASLKRLLFRMMWLPYAKRMFYAQGMGRHTEKEVMDIANGDLKALSVFLGKKPFFMGDKPSEVDCAIFGMLAQVKWQMPDSEPSKWIENEYANLGRYCERMRDEFWPDWDECITHGNTREPTK